MAARARHVTQGVVLAGAAMALAPQVWMRVEGGADIHSVTSELLRPAQSALVLGARVWEDGRPSLFLRERVEVAATLYHSGLVERVLVSGAGSNREGLDEAAVMRDTALALGVPVEDIDVDRGGVNTAASCLRAHHVFGLTSVIAVSQEFHLPRATWWCRRVGMDAQGAFPPVLVRPHTGIGYVREVMASWKAVIDALR